jgi:hypothetical protein
MKKKNVRSMFIAIFVIIISWWNYSHLAGKECIRLIHEVTLVVLGAGIGVFVCKFLMLFRKEEPQK